MDSSYVLLIQARELCEAEKYSRALVIINKAISQNSFWPPLHRAKAQILVKMNKYNDAITTITAICELQPTDPKNWRVKGYVILFSQNTPSEDEIITAREALLESRKNMKIGDNDSWKKLELCFRKLHSFSHESSDLRLAEQCKPPPPPPVRCSECGEVKSSIHSFCLECGHKYE